MNYELRIEFANIRQAKVLRLEALREKAINSFRQRFADDAEEIALGFALKLSISGSNIDRMVPMVVQGHTVSSETFMSCVKPQRGQDVEESALTVSRFCAALADDISNYLQHHPDQVRMNIENVDPRLSFPHNYYVSNLTHEDRESCIMWLNHHDNIMNQVTNGNWRSLALKAIAYFVANYS